MNYILSDKIDSGKSTFVMELTQDLLQRGYRVGGFLTPAWMNHGQKAGQDFVAIAGDHLEPAIAFTRPAREDDAIRWDRFAFNAAAFERSLHLPPRCDFLIADEIGPLELMEHRGFLPALSYMFEEPCHLLCIVREGLKDALLQLMHPRKVHIASLEEMPRIMHQVMAGSPPPSCTLPSSPQ